MQGGGTGKAAADSYWVEEAGDVGGFAGVVGVVDEASVTVVDRNAGVVGDVAVGETAAALGFVVGAAAALIGDGQSAEKVAVGCVAIGSPGRTWVREMACSDERGLRLIDWHDGVNSSSNH